jgi:hypothetical protein
MRKYHGHTLLYLHETIALGSGSSDRFTAGFVDTYQPMMEELGARLFCLWETTPYNGHWPQVTIIWESDTFADYARIGAAQAPGGSHEAAAGQSWKESPPAEIVTWMSVAPALRDGWEDSILQALPPSPLQ